MQNKKILYGLVAILVIAGITAGGLYLNPKNGQGLLKMTAKQTPATDCSKGNIKNSICLPLEKIPPLQPTKTKI